MPASAAMIEVAGKASLEYYVKNEPVDQIDTGRPWIDKLRSRKKLFGGGKEHVVVQLRKDYGESGEWYFGSQLMSYTRRDPLEQAFYAWRSFRDGYTMDEDDFIRNGLVVDNSGNARMNGADRVVLTNIFKEKNEDLKLGFRKQMDQNLLRNGATTADAFKGLDHLVSYTPSTGTKGNINTALAANAWWRNNANTGLTSSNLISTMEIAFRACQRNGGMPDFIMAGDEAIDLFRAASIATGQLQRFITIPMAGGQPKLDPGTGESSPGGVMTGLMFKGVPILYNPVFEDLATLETSASPAWRKRIYMINCRHITEMPVRNYEDATFTPPVVYDRPESRFYGIKYKGTVISKRLNAHWAGAIS